MRNAADGTADGTKSGNDFGTIASSNSSSCSTGKEILQVPCGQCIGCRIDRSRQWANRCMLELQYHDSAYFVTLTYDDLHVPKAYYPDPDTGEAHQSLTLCKRDFQLWMKRLRKRFSDDKIRFFACGEYGGSTHRPHYHAIVFGLHLDDLVKYKTVQEGDGYYTYYNSDSLQSTMMAVVCLLMPAVH